MERMKGAVIKKSIIYGSMSFYQGKKADEQNSHKWACYVRGYDNEDISSFIKKIVFTLHPSFSNPVRTVERAPFEIHETGWGEFDILIQLYFHETREKKLDINHSLQLYPKQQGSSQSTKKPVISEHYDEIVFVDPYPEFFQKLSLSEGIPADSEAENSAFHQEIVQYYPVHSKTAALKQLEDAYAYIRQEAEDIREKLRKSDQEIASLRQELREEEKKVRETNAV